MSRDQIHDRLIHVAKNENVNISDDGVDAILSLSNGDMRRVLNLLQAPSMGNIFIRIDKLFTLFWITFLQAIPEPVFSFYLGDEADGELTFGGYDSSKFEGNDFESGNHITLNRLPMQ